MEDGRERSLERGAEIPRLSSQPLSPDDSLCFSAFKPLGLLLSWRRLTGAPLVLF